MSETAAMSKRPWSDEATLEDIYYCYRILLLREPSQEDLEYWSDRVTWEGLTYLQLVSYFRKSREYVVGKKARGIDLITLDDFEMYVQSCDWDIGENIIHTRKYEPHVTSFLKEYLQEGMTFVDVGANIGYFTLTAAKQVGSSGKVIAVECNHENCELIYLSLHRNGFNHVTVYPFAVSDTQKFMSYSWGFSNGFVDELGKDDEDAFIVPAVTLDSLLKKENSIDAIKIDIEGSEVRAWQGMQATIAQHHPLLLMEFFPTLLKRASTSQPQALVEGVLAQGYSAAVLRREQAAVPASSALDVMSEWEKERDAVGDEAKAYLDLAFIPAQE